MIFSKIAVAGGIVLLGFLCFLAAIGTTVVTEGLITVFALVVLVAGGNLLSGRSGHSGTRGGHSGDAAAGAPAQGEPDHGSDPPPPAFPSADAVVHRGPEPGPT